MRSRIKVFGLVLLAAVLMGISFVAGAVLQPRPILKAWISITERNVARRQIRLGQLLRQGMTPDQVKAILGEPDRAEDVGSESWREGVRWHYSWGGGGSGLIVEFRYLGPPRFKPPLRLCYAHPESGAVHYFPDTDPEYFTIGTPLKGR
jgi:hypothetical protein